MPLNRKRGISLIIVIMVMAFLFSVGLLLLSITGTGPRIAGNVRFYQEAFNAAEAGFDASWALLNELFISGQDASGNAWTSFAGHYIEGEKDFHTPFIGGNDQNPNPYFYQRLTDEEILSEIDKNNDGKPNYNNLLFFNYPWIPGQGRSNLDYSYTCFLINDEAGGSIEDPKDARLICIGVVRARNKILATSRIEVLIAFEGQ